MASKTDICNMALTAIGEAVISDFAQDGTLGKMCRLHYPFAVNSLAEQRPWSFMETRQQLSPTGAGSDDLAWDYAYSVPAGCLKIIRIEPEDISAYDVNATPKWIQRGQTIYAQDASLWIVFNRDVEVGFYPQTFAEAIAGDLQPRFALHRRLSEETIARAQRVADATLDRACFVDAQKMSHQHTVSNSASMSNFLAAREG